MDKNYIENYIIQNNIDISALSSIQLITIIMEQVETIKGLKGADKKNYVIRLLNELIGSDDNLFIKTNNLTLIINTSKLLENNIIGDIIDTIISCINGDVNLKSNIKKACCFPVKK
jgi:hypothetical protein